MAPKKTKKEHAALRKATLEKKAAAKRATAVEAAVVEAEEITGELDESVANIAPADKATVGKKAEESSSETEDDVRLQGTLTMQLRSR